MSNIELPAMPEPAIRSAPPESNAYAYGYHADQLRARDRQIVELCARMCDQHETARWDAYKHGPAQGSDYVQGLSNGAGECAAAIRSLLDEKKGGE